MSGKDWAWFLILVIVYFQIGFNIFGHGSFRVYKKFLKGEKGI